MTGDNSSRSRDYSRLYSSTSHALGIDDVCRVRLADGQSNCLGIGTITNDSGSCNDPDLTSDDDSLSSSIIHCQRVDDVGGEWTDNLGTRAICDGCGC